MQFSLKFAVSLCQETNASSSQLNVQIPLKSFSHFQEFPLLLLIKHSPRYLLCYTIPTVNNVNSQTHFIGNKSLPIFVYMRAGLFAARSSTIATCERLLNVQFQVNIIIFHCIHELIHYQQDLLTYFFYYC